MERAIWAGAASRPGWRGPAVIAATIPALTALAILAIDPTFFGGWMLVASVLLAAAGLALASRAAPRA